MTGMYNSSKKAIRDPDSQGEQKRGPSPEAQDLLEAQPKDHTLQLKLCWYLLLKGHIICTFLSFHFF